MGTENEPNPNTPPQGTAAPIVPPVGTTPPAGDPPPERGKNVVLPSHVFADRLKKAKSQGQAAYVAELDKQAVAKGFANHAALMQYVDEVRSRAPVKPVKPNGQSSPPPKPAKAGGQEDRRVQQLEREKRDREDKLAREQKARRRAERERDAIEARSNLERIASGVGIKKVGQAIYLYEEHCRGKSEEELGKMDETAFFEGLRKTDAYLFGETTVPATTGTAGAPPGSHVPAPGATAAAAGAAGVVDVTKMTKEQYREYRRSKGYGQPVASGRVS
jgi:hypothetical protein